MFFTKPVDLSNSPNLSVFRPVKISLTTKYHEKLKAMFTLQNFGFTNNVKMLVKMLKVKRKWDWSKKKSSKKFQPLSDHMRLYTNTSKHFTHQYYVIHYTSTLYTDINTGVIFSVVSVCGKLWIEYYTNQISIHKGFWIKSRIFLVLCVL